jgi:hypothetical protein
MSTKHLVQGLMQVTGARNHAHCTKLLGLPQGSLCRLNKGEHRDLKVSTLVHIRAKSGVPLDTLADWFGMPAERSLGRVTAEPLTVNGRQVLRVRYESGWARVAQVILLACAAFCFWAGADHQDEAAAIMAHIRDTAVAIWRG